MKYCVDCKHHKKGKYINADLCKLALKDTDHNPITGRRPILVQEVEASCLEMRLDGACGFEGSLYEPKWWVRLFTDRG